MGTSSTIPKLFNCCWKVSQLQEWTFWIHNNTIHMYVFVQTNICNTGIFFFGQYSSGLFFFLFLIFLQLVYFSLCCYCFDWNQYKMLRVSCLFFSIVSNINLLTKPKVKKRNRAEVWQLKWPGKVENKNKEDEENTFF